MVREHFRMILRAPQALDPLRGETVPLGSLPTRDLAVGDIADEQVSKRVLGLVGY